MTATDLAAQTEAAADHIRRIALGDILRRSARRYRDKVALVDGDATLTYRQMDAAANRFAHHLLGLGLKAPAKVGMLCANSIDMLVANFGIFKAGVTWVPINHTLGADAIGINCSLGTAYSLSFSNTLAVTNYTGAMTNGPNSVAYSTALGSAGGIGPGTTSIMGLILPQPTPPTGLYTDNRTVYLNY